MNHQFSDYVNIFDDRSSLGALRHAPLGRPLTQSNLSATLAFSLPIPSSPISNHPWRRMELPQCAHASTGCWGGVIILSDNVEPIKNFLTGNALESSPTGVIDRYGNWTHRQEGKRREKETKIYEVHACARFRLSECGGLLSSMTLSLILSATLGQRRKLAFIVFLKNFARPFIYISIWFSQ